MIFIIEIDFFGTGKPPVFPSKIEIVIDDCLMAAIALAQYLKRQLEDEDEISLYQDTTQQKRTSITIGGKKVMK